MEETITNGLETPPPGVTAGESVPRENSRDDQQQAQIEGVANRIKAHPAYRKLSESERRRKARELLASRGAI